MLACVTVKPGKECVFMKKAGCAYNGGKCHPVIESCSGCSNIQEYATGQFCRVFAEPAVKWNQGKCGMATHVQDNRETETTSKKLNPLKASKRGGR